MKLCINLKKKELTAEQKIRFVDEAVETILEQLKDGAQSGKVEWMLDRSTKVSGSWGFVSSETEE